MCHVILGPGLLRQPAQTTVVKDGFGVEVEALKRNKERIVVATKYAMKQR